MLKTLQEIEGCRLDARDGPLGPIVEALFDDESWALRYFVVDAREWLGARRVLLSPFAIARADWAAAALSTAVTRDQVKRSPAIDTDRPITRAVEMQQLAHFGYPYYWAGGAIWGGGVYPSAMMLGRAGFAPPRRTLTETQQAYARNAAARCNDRSARLHAGRTLARARVNAIDGKLGAAQELLVDSATWALRFIAVRTGEWWPGHSILIAPEWIRDADWAGAALTLDLHRDQVRGAPAYDASRPLDRDGERALYDHYGCAGYWVAESAHAPAR